MDEFKIDYMPDGWIVVKGAQTAPRGWVWVSNGKSRFVGEYEHALVLEDEARRE